MKILVRIIVFLVIVVLLLLVGSLFIPKTWKVEAATAIGAEPMDVFQVVNDLQTWGEWTAWTKEKYPEMTRRYEGADSGKGAVMHWDDGNMPGVLEVVGSMAPSSFEYKLSMDAGKNWMSGNFEFMPDAEGTRVIWSCSGSDANPVAKYFMLFFKSQIKNDFSLGLEGLKKRLESDS